MSPSQHERALAQARGMDLVGDHFGLEALGVPALHQVRSLDAVGVGRPVIHIGRGHELAALRHAGDQHRPQVGPRRCNRGGITRRAGAENQERACRVAIRGNANISPWPDRYRLQC